MSVTDIILATFASTVTLIAVGILVYRVVRAWRRYAKQLLAAVEANVAATSNAAHVVGQVQGELAYMRQLSQGVVAQQAEAPRPPVGRAGKMPPAFPERDWSAYAPDAKPEDTDHSLLTETDEDVMAAQAREEMRGRGMEPDDEGVPQSAVVEEV